MKKTISLFIILSLILSLFLGLNLPGSSDQENAKSPGGFLNLLAPPKEALAAGEDYGEPLNTTEIGFFMYYEDSGGFTLADTVAAWQSYEDHSTYYDGTIRIYFNGNGSTFVTGSEYIDVYARLTAEGWATIWLNDTIAATRYLVHWGNIDVGGNPQQGFYATGDSPYIDNRTCLYRALERIYWAQDADWSNLPGPDEVYYYDYSFPTATMFVYFGKGVEGTTAGSGWSSNYTVYYTIPSDRTVLEAYSQHLYGVEDASTENVEIYYDGVRIVNQPDPTDVLLAGYDVAAGYITTGVQHRIYIRGRASGATDYFLGIATLMLWLS